MSRAAAHWLMAGGSVALLLTAIGLLVTLASQGQAVGYEGMPQPTVLCDATGIENCEPVKKFDVKQLYKDPPEIDQDHPSRIDFYGQMFQKFPDGTDTIMQKVFKLKKKLKKLAQKQAAFEKRLDEPVKTTMTVEAGEPGRMGARGPRGAVGPPGFMGKTGPMGRPGYQGRPGLPGDMGNRGPDGPRGPTGDRGREGVQGTRGPVGRRGYPGQRGPRGPPGPKGYAGAPGPQGLDGQQGNRGPRGQSPAGPYGSAGVSGAPGPQGPKGGLGSRGPPGPPGYPGTRGDPGQPGYRGKPGRDAKQLPKSKCGIKDELEHNMCCGIATVDWHNYHNVGSFMDINTGACKFKDDSVMYFTEIAGNGGQWTSVGAQAIYSSHKSGFRVYIAQDNGGVARSWWMNSLQHRIKWCGVGFSNGPVQAGACCGVASKDVIRRSGGALYADVSTKECKFGGDPIYFSSIYGNTRNGVSKNWDLTGTGASYPSIGPAKKWFRVWLGGFHHLGWTTTNYANRNIYDWRVGWCGFGTVFPTGDMQVNMKEIDEDDYPCNGARFVQGTSVYDSKVTSSKASMCCGIEDDTSWKSLGGGMITHTVDTSHCKFKSLPAYMISMRGSSSHWQLNGITSPIDPSEKGFKIQLTPNQGAMDASQALSYNYKLQWCGVGVRDK